MPIPFLLAGLAIGAAALGAGGHISAQETNEKAQNILKDAKDLYNSAKYSLECEQSNTEQALLKLGYIKKSVLDSSMRQFAESYEKIKFLEMKSSTGIEEISKFEVEQQDIIEIREMTDIYSSVLQSGATGAAAGTIVALAASGSLTLIGSELAVAGSALALGEVGMAAGIAGSALSFGAAMTPLAAVVAPAVLFTGISASMKADENLEKAEAKYAEAEAAVEKMKVSETLCIAITKKSEMFEELLEELDSMFAQCTSQLAGIIRKKERRIFKKKLDFSEDEYRLIAVTRSLAGAVKAVIDTPILSQNGNIAQEAEKRYDEVAGVLEHFNKEVEEIQQIDYHAKPIVPVEKSKAGGTTASGAGALILRGARNILAMVIGVFVASSIAINLALSITQGNTKIFFVKSLTANKFAIWFFIFAFITMIIGKFREGLFSNIMLYGSAISLSILYYAYCRIVVNQSHPVILSIIVFVVGSVLMSWAEGNKNSVKGKYLYGIFGSIMFIPIMYLIYHFLGVCIGIFPEVILNATGIFMCLIAMVNMMDEEKKE